MQCFQTGFPVYSLKKRLALSSRFNVSMGRKRQASPCVESPNAGLGRQRLSRIRLLDGCVHERAIQHCRIEIGTGFEECIDYFVCRVLVRELSGQRESSRGVPVPVKSMVQRRRLPCFGFNPLLALSRQELHASKVPVPSELRMRDGTGNIFDRGFSPRKLCLMFYAQRVTFRRC